MERQKKNILKNHLRDIVPSHKIHHLLQVLYRKSFAMKTLGKKKKLQKNKNKRKWKKKKQKKRSKKTRNLRE